MPFDGNARSVVEGNRAYFLARLADPNLLDQAIVVTFGPQNDRRSDLAVPVGGVRRAGEMCVGTRREGSQVIRQLGQYPRQFPNLRFVPGGRNYMANVCWGEVWDEGSEDLSIAEIIADTRERGHLFGYSETAIQQSVSEWQKSAGLSHD